MSDLKKNGIITLDITDLNNLGYGVGRHEGVVIFVQGAAAGDRIECRIIKVNKNYCIGRLEKIITPSPYRTDKEFCKAPASCGGCVYRSITYTHELELKRNFILNTFRHAGLPDVKIGEVKNTGIISGYRNKAQYPVGQTADGHLFAGFYAAGTHKIATDADCSLQPEVFAEIAREICDFATAIGVRAYNEKTGNGLLRHIYIRSAEKTGEIMVCLVLTGSFFPRAAELAELLINRHPEIVGILLNKNNKNTNVVLGYDYTIVAGRYYIEDILCGLRFRITPDSFYQVNRDGAELLYGIAKDKAVGDGRKGGTLLDIYCGTGTIGLTMAKDFDKVIGIEIVPSAVECANINAELNNIENASFYCGNASDTEGLLGAAERERGQKIDADTVILDPPRKGSTPELIKYIAERGIERVVYVSCSPDTLARDCALFAELGYKIGEVTPVDMFPRTGHVECVVLMSRIKD